MINVLASIKVKKEFKEKFIEIFKANVPLVLAEKGCLGYMPTVDFPTGLAPQKLDDTCVTIIEQWESFSHLQDHLKAPHMAVYKEKTKNMTEGSTLKILQEA